MLLFCRLTAILGVAALAACSTASRTPLPADPAVRVLIVTGHDHPSHDWPRTTAALEDILRADPRFQVTILTDPYKLETVSLSPYDVVFLHFSAGRLQDTERKDPGERARASLKRFVEEGGGLFLLHFSCFAFRDWPDFEALAGRVWDRKTGHDAYGPFQVRIVDPAHPVSRGLTDFPTVDELYICLTGDRPVDVLAVARSKKTGRDHPMAFVHQHGKGRVFHTPLGHSPEGIRQPGAAELIRRGLAWAAGKEAVGP